MRTSDGATATASATTTAYLGLGSNLGDREGLLAAAVNALAHRGILRDLAVSPLYETDAVACDVQPPYLNAVVRGTTGLQPEELLAACLEIEDAFGRVRPGGRGNAPAPLDIDLLLHGSDVRAGPTLIVPHPRMLGRPFVLIPLADVAAADLAHPISGASLTFAGRSTGVRQVRGAQERWW